MAKKVSKLKEFAKQYRHLYIEDYLYIECPRPEFEMLESSNWSPVAEDVPAVMGAIKKRGIFKQFSYFYDKKNRCYYVIDHLWLATLASWGEDKMQQYMRDVLSRMLSKTWDKMKVIEAVSKAEYRTVVDVVDENLESIKKSKLSTLKEGSDTLSLIKEEVMDSMFHEKYGITKVVYDNMLPESYVVEVDDTYALLDICKLLFKEEQTAMKDIYKKLNQLGIISQPPKDQGGKYNIYLSNDWIKQGFGFNASKRSSFYPFLYAKGVVMIGMVLHDHGLTSKYILPKV